VDEARDESADTHPKIDFSQSLGAAGHEVEDLGFEGLPDDGDVEETTETINAEDEARSARDLALDRGQFGLPRLPKG
jgi:hypothetical protein